MFQRALITIFSCIFVISCAEITGETEPSRVVPAGSSVDKIEFRIFGNVGGALATIRHTNSIDGLTQFVGNLPYVATLDSREESIFLYVEASVFSLNTSGSGTLQVQIFVNGKLFRETFVQGFSLFAQASGTYRRD